MANDIETSRLLCSAAFFSLFQITQCKNNTISKNTKTLLKKNFGINLSSFFLCLKRCIQKAQSRNKKRGCRKSVFEHR